MPTVLVTGANRGIGLAFVRQYMGAGWSVIATCRRPEEAHELEAIGGGIDIRALDLGEPDSIEQLGRGLNTRPIDLLISNAGVYGPRDAAFGRINYTAWEEVMQINCFGQTRLVERLVENVARSDLRRIALLSSKMGSMDDNSSGGQYIYRSSKAALNAVGKSMAIDLAPRGISVVILHPGWVRTEMGGPHALISTEESVAGMTRVLDSLGPAQSGRFLDYKGIDIPW